ncbi:hypothetical protein EJ05DRAFT_489940 [Pseudovirgaria hyperparasitica]|uniref:Uncharacterized protein n=1 Tax=Pseudovirgaria hyperparasitica TaxID=470096 RepID=A0A6A6VT61_9PEZI|nr:uncharacterized protein EJ05DRAFT_489940 [Pseudovirgaria hyperparasitica]KAF2753772.1 hypothetical protein EJ05DRAFT_489940 [Pseudovirgaria hyperparasitica]
MASLYNSLADHLGVPYSDFPSPPPSVSPAPSLHYPEHSISLHTPWRDLDTIRPSAPSPPPPIPRKSSRRESLGMHYPPIRPRLFSVASVEDLGLPSEGAPVMPTFIRRHSPLAERPPARIMSRVDSGMYLGTSAANIGSSLRSSSTSSSSSMRSVGSNKSASSFQSASDTSASSVESSSEATELCRKATLPRYTLSDPPITLLESPPTSISVSTTHESVSVVASPSSFSSRVNRLDQQETTPTTPLQSPSRRTSSSLPTTSPTSSPKASPRASPRASPISSHLSPSSTPPTASSIPARLRHHTSPQKPDLRSLRTQDSETSLQRVYEAQTATYLDGPVFTPSPTWKPRYRRVVSEGSRPTEKHKEKEKEKSTERVKERVKEMEKAMERTKSGDQHPKESATLKAPRKSSLSSSSLSPSTITRPEPTLTRNPRRTNTPLASSLRKREAAGDILRPALQGFLTTPSELAQRPRGRVRSSMARGDGLQRRSGRPRVRFDVDA